MLLYIVKLLAYICHHQTGANPMDKYTYEELQAMRTQGHDEATRLGYTHVDVDAVEKEIAKRDQATMFPMWVTKV